MVQYPWSTYSVGLTGQSITSSVGSLTVNDLTIGLTGLRVYCKSRNSYNTKYETVIVSGLSITSEQGTATASSTTEASLTGVSFSASVGTVTIPNDVVQLSGVSAEFSLGSIVGLGGAINSTISLSITPSVGSLTIEEGLGLTGQSFSASVGSLSLNDITIGLTGQSSNL